MWARALGVAIGVWLMAAPTVLGYDDAFAADLARVIGPLAASAAMIAIGESVRFVRWATVPLGVALIVVPLVDGQTGPALVNNIMCGLLLFGVAQVRGSLDHRLGGGWSVLWK